jgi:PAS domain S-box-containing protein
VGSSPIVRFSLIETRRGRSDTIGTMSREPTAGVPPRPAIVLETMLGQGAEEAEVGIYIYDDDGRYVAVNKFGAELLGYDRDELLTHDVGDFTNGIDRTVLLKRERREGTRIVRRKDGHELPVAFVVIPTRVGQLGFFMSFVWEIAGDDPRLTSRG